jgi:hypothetical protein
MTRDARLSALHRGGFGLPGPRFRLLGRPPSHNGGQVPFGSVQRAPRTQVVVPGGRGPCLPRRTVTSRRRRTPRLAPHSGSSLEHALNERGWRSYSLSSFRSQEINSFRSRKCSQMFAAAVEKWIVADSRNSKEYLETQQAIDRALTKALWRSNRVDVYDTRVPDTGEINLRLDGTVLRLPATQILPTHREPTEKNESDDVLHKKCRSIWK